MGYRFLLISFIFLFVSRCSQTSNEEKTEQENVQNYSNEETSSLINLANSYYENDQYSNAIEVYDELISRDSSNGEYYYRTAYSLTQLDEYENASLNYLKSIELGYRAFDAYYALGLFNSTLLFNDSLAIRYLNEALKLRPDSDKVKELLGTLTKTNEVVL